jgi:hypothetical protein
MPQIPRLPLKALTFLSFFVLPSAAFSQAQIYHWVDVKGIHHYSDTQPDNRSQDLGYNVSAAQRLSKNQVNYAKGSPTCVGLPLATLLDPKEKEYFVRRGINIEQKILVLFDDTY